VSLYSTRFVSSTDANVWHTYVVPGGHLAIVQSILATCNNSVAATYMATVGGVLVGLGLVPAVGDRHAVNLRAVAFAGEKIECAGLAAGLSVSVHGYLLDAAGAAASGEHPTTTRPVDVDQVAVRDPHRD